MHPMFVRSLAAAAAAVADTSSHHQSSPVHFERNAVNTFHSFISRALCSNSMRLMMMFEVDLNFAHELIVERPSIVPHQLAMNGRIFALDSIAQNCDGSIMTNFV